VTSTPVKLRPTREDELPLLLRVVGDPEVAGQFVWAGYGDQNHFRRSFDDNGLVSWEGGILLVALATSDEAVGMVTFTKRQTGAAVYCWEIGIAMLPSARGHGYGTAAQRELVRYLFAHTLAHRIEANTEADNHAEQRSLEKAGFTQEGVMRGRDWRDGQWRDAVLYSILRTDPQP
jgi:RimJ/RimL family protein N-acetyltransferase